MASAGGQLGAGRGKPEGKDDIAGATGDPDGQEKESGNGRQHTRTGHGSNTQRHGDMEQGGAGADPNMEAVVQVDVGAPAPDKNPGKRQRIDEGPVFDERRPGG